MSPLDPQRFLGLDDREFEEFRSGIAGRRGWRLLLWLAWVKRRRFVRGLFVVVVGLAGVALVWAAFLSIVEPWNHSLYLWPTLTGDWYGEFAAPDGRQAVRMQIEGGTGDMPSIEGTTTTCDRRGTLRQFSISGSPRGWRGTRFAINTARRDEFDDAGVRFATIEGEWKGNEMQVTATLERFKQVRGASISSTADPPLPEPVVHFNLVRGTSGDFANACQQLARGR